MITKKDVLEAVVIGINEQRLLYKATLHKDRWQADEYYRIKIGLCGLTSSNPDYLCEIRLIGDKLYMGQPFNLHHLDGEVKSQDAHLYMNGVTIFHLDDPNSFDPKLVVMAVNDHISELMSRKSSSSVAGMTNSMAAALQNCGLLEKPTNGLQNNNKGNNNNRSSRK